MNDRAAIREHMEAQKAQARKSAISINARMPELSASQKKVVMGLQAKIDELEQENEMLRRINQKIAFGRELPIHNRMTDWTWLLELEIGEGRITKMRNDATGRRRVYSSLRLYRMKHGIECAFEWAPEGWLITRIA